MPKGLKSLVLLGDSVFDNGVYVNPGEADVASHLRRKLAPIGYELDMRALDGAVVDDVGHQLAGRPFPLPCLFVLSVGGNDALRHVDLVGDVTSKRSIAEVLFLFNQIREEFRASYAKLLDRILIYEQPLVVCTIYNPQFTEPDLQKLAETGLSFFNDVITEEVLRRRLPIIDLRDVCFSPEAFANPIEPSEYGGDLITDAIIDLLQT